MNKNRIIMVASDAKAKCACCGKEISDVEYIRYGGVCKICWR